jgi:hypothetical protein
MSCCGSRRRAHRAWMVARPVRLRYLGDESTQVIGNATGRPYSFTTVAREMDVDPHDAQGLLQTQSFVVANSMLMRMG